MTDWELRACATTMRERHDEDAAIDAAQRADSVGSLGVSKLTNWERWACANEMPKQHGTDASVLAAMSADAMVEADGPAGYAV